MKKVSIFAVVLLMLFFVLPHTAEAAPVQSNMPIYVVENGDRTKFIPQLPLLNNNSRLFMPVRELERLYQGVQIDWNGETRAVTVKKDGKVAIYKIGSYFYEKNGKLVYIDVAPFIDMNTNRTYIPIRFVSDGIEENIEYDNATNSVMVYKNAIDKKAVQFRHDGKTEYLNVGIDKFKFDYKIKSPDSIGNIWGAATFTNNTEYPVTSMVLTIKKADNDTTYAMHNLTSVLPGAKSTNFNFLLGKSSKYEVLKYEYIFKKDGLTYNVTYDVALGEYETIVY